MQPEELPAEWRAASAVLCVAGRAALDGAASAMLGQLLAKHGFGARVMPHAVAGTRAALAAVDIADVQMICLISAGGPGSASQMRYTVRRLRHRLPDAAILVGLLPAETLRDDRLRAAIGADRYAASLREALAECREQALGVPAAAEPASAA